MPSTRLSPRLQAIAELVPPCRRLLDIGTDHALLPISLMLQGKCTEVLAIDIRPGPLRVAARNIAAAGLTGRIDIRQNDGLAGITAAADDVIILAGIGGYEIRDILAASPQTCRRVVIQAMKSLPELREWLSANDFSIDDERLVQDQGRFYVIIACTPATVSQPLSHLAAWAGPVLIRERPPDYGAYLHHLLPRLAKMCRADDSLRSLLGQIKDLLQTLSDQ